MFTPLTTIAALQTSAVVSVGRWYADYSWARTDSAAV